MNVNGFNLSKTVNSNIVKNSQIISLNTPLLNSSVKSNQDDKFENGDKKNFFQNMKENIKRLFNCCNPKSKENEIVNEPRDSAISIDSNFMVDDNDTYQGLYIIEDNVPKKQKSSSVPILSRNYAYKNKSLLPQNSSMASSSTSNTPIKTSSSYSSFYPRSYDSVAENAKKYLNCKSSPTKPYDLEEPMSPLSNSSYSSSSYSSF